MLFLNPGQHTGGQNADQTCKGIQNAGQFWAGFYVIFLNDFIRPVLSISNDLMYRHLVHITPELTIIFIHHYNLEWHFVHRHSVYTCLLLCPEYLTSSLKPVRYIITFLDIQQVLMMLSNAQMTPH